MYSVYKGIWDGQNENLLLTLKENMDMKTDKIHKRITELIQLIEINHNRLVLNESSYELDMAQIRAYTVELYSCLDALELGGKSEKKPAVEPKPEREIVVKVPESKQMEDVPLEREVPPVVPETPKRVFTPEAKKEEDQPVAEPEPKKSIEPEVKKEVEKEPVLINEVKPDVEAIKKAEEVREKSKPKKEEQNTSKEVGTDVYDRLRRQGLDSIKKGISISKRYQIQNELFDNDANKYNEAIETLDKADEFEHAQALLLDTMALDNKWDPEHPLLEELHLLLQRRYL